MSRRDYLKHLGFTTQTAITMSNVSISTPCSKPDCPYCKGTGEIKVVAETTSQISYYECYGSGGMSGQAKRTERMSNNNTQLPVEVVAEIQRKALYYTKYGQPKTKTITDSRYNGYETSASEAAHLLFEVFQKHESGLLPDRFIYDKIKKFLHG